MELEKLTKDYDKNGYIIFENFFNKMELDDFKNSFFQIVNSYIQKYQNSLNIYEIQSMDDLDRVISFFENNDSKVIGEIYDIVPYNPSFLRLISKVEFNKVVNSLLKQNSELYCYTNRCRIDPPQVTRRSTDWHQEIYYTIPKSIFLQTWGPLLRSIKKENGAIEICVGSHNEGLSAQIKSDDPGNPTPFSIPPEIIDKYEKISIELELGDLMFFNPYLFHKSGYNSSSETRFSLIGMYHLIKNNSFFPPKISYEYRKNYDDF